ncbi:MAG: hypothetical protein ACI82S_000772, partial [Patiriisocius sp.]
MHVVFAQYPHLHSHSVHSSTGTKKPATIRLRVSHFSLR